MFYRVLRLLAWFGRDKTEQENDSKSEQHAKQACKNRLNVPPKLYSGSHARSGAQRGLIEKHLVKSHAQAGHHAKLGSNTRGTFTQNPQAQRREKYSRNR